jgi:hypothetical protein
MPRDEWKERYAERNHVKDEPFEQPDGSYSLTPTFDIPDERLGLILTPPEVKLARRYGVPFDLTLEDLGLVPVPAILPVDPLYTGYANIPPRTLVDGHTKGYWTSQTGGTCGGFGTATGKIDDFSNPDDIVILDGMDQYFAIREGKVPASEVKNINEGVMSAWVKDALLDAKKGGRRRGSGVWLPRDPQYNASSCWWSSSWQEVEQIVYNSWLRYTGQASTPRMGVDIGIPVYSSFLSPKEIPQADGSKIWAVYWQTGSWGAFRGGHWMRIAGFSRKIKVRPGSAGSVFLPGTWADQGFPEAWMAVEDLMKCMATAMGGDILAIVSKETGPVGKLELQKFSIIPAVPVVGDKVQFTFEAKNTGTGVLTGIQLGIEEKHDDVYPDGYRGPVVNLAPGEAATFNPQSAPLTAGHWRWRADNLKPYTVLSTIEVDVTGTPPPPPPPPPPSDTITRHETVTDVDTGEVWTTEIDQPDGVIYRKVQ